MPKRHAATHWGEAALIGMRAAFLEMASNRFRSLLTLMGVALSIGSVTAMLSILQGLNFFMKDTVESMGGINRVGVRQESADDLRQELLFSRSPGLRLTDADAVNENDVPGVRMSKTTQNWMRMRYQSVSEYALVKGLDARTLREDEKVLLDQGRFITTREFAIGEKVCVIGWKVVEKLEEIRKRARLPEMSPVGESMFIGDQSYLIIGTFTKKYMRYDRPGYYVYIPIQAMIRDMSGPNPPVEWMTARIAEADSLDVHAEVLAGFLKSEHRGTPDVSFRFFDWVGDFQTMFSNMRMVFLFIAFISLTVGGVSILNVMLSTIYERVREIGIRKSLGATSAQIFLQFLAESLCLSVIGGLLGAMVGTFPLLLADELEKATRGIRPHLDAQSFVIVMAIAVGLGILSGIYPALRAARMNPMEALRYE